MIHLCPEELTITIFNVGLVQGTFLDTCAIRLFLPIYLNIQSDQYKYYQLAWKTTDKPFSSPSKSMIG